MGANLTKILTGTVRDQFVDYIDKGLSIESVCQALRIPFTPIQTILQYGEGAISDPQYDPDDYSPDELLIINFYLDVMQAKAKVESRLVSLITQHAEGDWKAAERILKSINPGLWDKKKAITKTANYAAPPEIAAANPLLNAPRLDLTLLTVDELLEFEALVKKATPAIDRPLLLDHESR